MITVKLELYKECKHSVRYNEDLEDLEASVPSVYIKKSALQNKFDKFPKRLALTITAEKE